MIPSVPQCCSHEVFETLSNIVQSIETPHALVDAAVTISRHHLPRASIRDSQRHLWAMANTVASRVHGRQPQAILAHLHEYLFEECGYRGNATNYYAPANSFLPAVLETQTGLPITLALVYKTVAERVGLKAWGIGMPGHFIVGVEAGGQPMWVDAYSAGRLLTPAEAQQRVATQFGQEIPWSERLTQPVTNRYWITRILQNLLTAYGRIGRYEDLAAILEMELLLWPNEGRLYRDLAIVMARIGRGDAASRWLDHYLATHPDDPQSSDLRHLLESLT